MVDTSFREREFQDLGVQVRWLDKEHAKNAYTYASKYMSKESYALDSGTVRNIETHIIKSESVAIAWVAQKIVGNGSVQIIFSPFEVCVMDTLDFLANWQNMFAPSRDDVVILHNLNNSILFYCHEEELSFGWRAA